MYDPASDPDLQPITPAPSPIQNPAPQPAQPIQAVPLQPVAPVTAEPIVAQPGPAQPVQSTYQPPVQPAVPTSPEQTQPESSWQAAVASSEAAAMSVAPDDTSSSKKKPLIIGGAAMLVLVLLGAGWLFGGKDLLNVDRARQLSQEEAAGAAVEDQLIAAAQESGEGDDATSSGTKDDNATAGGGNSGAGSSVVAKAAGGGNAASSSGYSIKCSIANSQKSEINATVKQQVERAIRVSYEGKLADHVSWVPPSIAKKIRNKNNQPKDVQKVFQSIKPKSCEIIGSLKPDNKGEMIGVMVRYKSAKTGATYQNSIMIVTVDNYAATLDVSKPEKI